MVFVIITFLFNPAAFYLSGCAKPCKLVVMYLCLESIDIISFYDFTGGLRNCYNSVECLVFQLICNKQNDIILSLLSVSMMEKTDVPGKNHQNIFLTFLDYLYHIRCIEYTTPWMSEWVISYWFTPGVTFFSYIIASINYKSMLSNTLMICIELAYKHYSPLQDMLLHSVISFRILGSWKCEILKQIIIILTISNNAKV